MRVVGLVHGELASALSVMRRCPHILTPRLREGCALLWCVAERQVRSSPYPRYWNRG